MNFVVMGYNECIIMYILVVVLFIYLIDLAVWYEGYMWDGEIVFNESVYGYDVVFDYNGEQAILVGLLFWAYYFFLGLNLQGL